MPAETTLSHSQMVRMSEVTKGYAKQDFAFWVSDDRVVHLTVFNLVYEIDVAGEYMVIVRKA